MVTIPVHNEAKLLYQSTHRLASGLDAAGLQYRLSIAEDGSTDRTIDVIAHLRAEFPGLVVWSSPNRLGRGLALRRLWSEQVAEVYAFVDADLAAGPGAVVDVIRTAQNGVDVVTGSRYCPGAIVTRPALRHVVSLSYNRIVRAAFHENIRDHQCGLKAFTRNALSKLLPMCKEDTWAWDTEILVLASIAGLNIEEVPIEWTEYRSNRTPIRRLVSDIYLHAESLARLRKRIRDGYLSDAAVPSPHALAPGRHGSTAESERILLR